MSYIEQYKRLRPKYVDFTNRIISLIQSILKGEGIDFHLVEGRAKTEASFEEKIKRKGKKYENPLEEITDLSGIRIIVYYQKDIEKAEKLLQDNFIIDAENSIKKSDLLKDNEFGYLSNHYIVRINEKRNDLPEWLDFRNFSAEIQLRTVLQHAWAAISHELQYKTKYDIPNLLKRRLYRLAGLFELADEEFGTVKKEQEKLNKAIFDQQELENEQVYEEINLITIRRFFETEKDILYKYKRHAINAGFDFDIAFLIEDLEDSLDRTYSEITRILSILKVSTISGFRQLLISAEPTALNYLTHQVKSHAGDRPDEDAWGASIPFIIVLILMSLLDSQVFQDYFPIDWNQKILERVKSVILDWKNSKSKKEKD